LLKPDFFSLIPKLVVNSPKIIKSSSGFDAIAQATESIFSKKANVHSLKYSLKSLHFSIKSFLEFVNTPNLNNAAQMLRAANFSGQAINIARTNAPHALSYLFTSKFKIPHGIAVSIFFIEIINLYYLAANKKNNINLVNRFNLFFRAIKRTNIQGFNNLFNKFFFDSGIKKFLDKSLKKIKYQNNFNNYYNLSRLNNSPIEILKEDISRLYLNKFKP
jgi:alcohol dehydrogenase class IV